MGVSIQVEKNKVYQCAVEVGIKARRHYAALQAYMDVPCPETQEQWRKSLMALDDATNALDAAKEEAREN